MQNTPLIRSISTLSPVIHETAWIAPSVSITGDIRIAAAASVWYGSSLRAEVEYVEIGEGSNIQDGCVSHTDPGFPAIIGKGVSVGHRAILHGCRVGDHSLIGMGAVLLNGSVIGDGSMVAAGTVVLEGTMIPPGSLVAGVPGKVRRNLTDDERQRIVENAETYHRFRDLHRPATD